MCNDRTLAKFHIVIEKKKELGDRNIELASLQVDVQRGELQYQRKCKILEVILNYCQMIKYSDLLVFPSSLLWLIKYFHLL